MNQGKINLVFSCGARIAATETPNFSKRDKSGRGRLLVYDSEGGEIRPCFPDGGLAGCLLACPCKKLSGRKQIQAVRSNGQFFPRRFIVTCYAEVRGD